MSKGGIIILGGIGAVIMAVIIVWVSDDEYKNWLCEAGAGKMECLQMLEWDEKEIKNKFGDRNLWNEDGYRQLRRAIKKVNEEDVKILKNLEKEIKQKGALSKYETKGRNIIKYNSQGKRIIEKRKAYHKRLLKVLDELGV